MLGDNGTTAPNLTGGNGTSPGNWNQRHHAFYWELPNWIRKRVSTKSAWSRIEPKTSALHADALTTALSPAGHQQVDGTHPVCRANLGFTHTVQVSSEDFIWLRNAKVICRQLLLYNMCVHAASQNQELWSVYTRTCTCWLPSCNVANTRYKLYRGYQPNFATA